MNKKILYILLVIIIALVGLIIFTQGKDKSTNDNFFSCLKNNGVVIYGTSTCPVCKQLRENLLTVGNNIDLVYVNCDENPQRCATEMKDNYVPEIQINKVVFPERSIKALSQETGCKIN
ncbi:MAG: Thioredoxin [Patescibacteria group bacterium]|nr:Thioredoxin [Patescibacteria group bacterium]